MSAFSLFEYLVAVAGGLLFIGVSLLGVYFLYLSLIGWAKNEPKNEPETGD